MVNAISNLYDNLMNGIVQMKLDGDRNVVYINNAACSLMGIDRKKAIECLTFENIIEYVYISDREYIKSVSDGFLQNKNTAHYKIRVNSPDDVLHVVRGMFTLNKNDLGEDVIQNEFIDITNLYPDNVYSHNIGDKNQKVSPGMLSEFVECLDRVDSAVFAVGMANEYFLCSEEFRKYSISNLDDVLCENVNILKKYMNEDDAEKYVNAVKEIKKGESNTEIHIHLAVNGGGMQRVKMLLGGVACCNLYSIICLIADEEQYNSVEERLKNRDTFFRSICKNSKLLTFRYIKTDDKLVYSGYSQQSGFDTVTVEHFSDEMSGYGFFIAEDSKKAVEIFDKALKADISEEFDCMLNTDGTGFKLNRIAYSSVKNESGDIIGIAGSVYSLFDYTEKIREAEAVAGRERLFKSLVQNGAIASVEFDITSGKRICSEYDIVPKEFPTELDFSTIVDYFFDELLSPADFALASQYARNLSNAQYTDKCGTFECRLRAFENSYEKFRWYRIKYINAVDKYTEHLILHLSVSDIDEEKQNELIAVAKRDNDALTGSLNRIAFEAYCDSAIQNRTEKGHPDAFVAIDIDNFKMVNDTFGLKFGDSILVNVANSLRAVAGKDSEIARLGGVRFAIYMHSIESEELLHEKLRMACLTLCRKVNDTIDISASIGAAICDDSVTSVTELYSMADRAQYVANKEGGNRYKMYTPEMKNIKISERAVLRSERRTGDDNHVYVRTFGYFDVFVDGKAVNFRIEKAKELLALLVDRRGGFVSAKEAITFLWEDEFVDNLTQSRYRKVAMRLKNILEENGIADIIEFDGGNRRIVPEKLGCDYYDYLSGKPEYKQLFTGSYMTNYSWGESTLADLEHGDDE